MKCEQCKNRDPLPGSRYCHWCLVGNEVDLCGVLSCPATPPAWASVGLARHALCDAHQSEFLRLGFLCVPDYLRALGMN